MFPWTPCEQASSSGGNRGMLPGGYFPVCPKASTIFCALVAVAQAGEGSSVFNLFLYQGSGQWKLWAQVRYLADFLAGYEGDSSAHFSHCFFLLSFSPSLHLCHCSQSIGKVIIFPFLKVVFETFYLRLVLKPMWQGLCAMLSNSVVFNWDLSPAKTHGAWFQDLMKLRFLMSNCKKNSARDTEIGKR